MAKIKSNRFFLPCTKHLIKPNSPDCYAGLLGFYYQYKPVRSNAPQFPKKS